MPINQEKSLRKPSGGRLRQYRKAKKHAKGSQPIMTRVGDRISVSKRVIGGNIKLRLRQEQRISVVDKKANKTIATTVQSVIDNPADKNLIRRNILTKGATVQTDLGKVLVTSRPGQSGVLNGVLIE